MFLARIVRELSLFIFRANWHLLVRQLGAKLTLVRLTRNSPKAGICPLDGNSADAYDGRTCDGMVVMESQQLRRHDVVSLDFSGLAVYNSARKSARRAVCSTGLSVAGR